MSNRKASPEQIAFLLKFKARYFAYSGPKKKESYLAEVLSQNSINLTVRQARRIMVGGIVKRKKVSAEWFREYRRNNPWRNVFHDAKRRCENPKCHAYKYYGAKGIRCFLTLADVKLLWQRDRASNLKRPSLDRIDQYGDYSVVNCRFIELSENCRRSKRKRKVPRLSAVNQ